MRVPSPRQPPVMRVRHRSLSLTASTLHPAVAAISILSLWRRAVSSSAAELGSVGEFRGSRVGLNDGVGAVRACGVLPARQDHKAARFEQKQEHRHSRGQVVVVHRGLRPSLRGALVLVATVATAMMAMMAMATATREVAWQRRGGDMRCRQSEGVRGRQR